MFALRTCLFISLSILPQIQAQDSQSANWLGFDKISNLFIFGDSYTATGFNINGTQPNTANPLGNPAFPGLTFSNGRNWVDFLSLTYNASVVSTYNFAFPGAVVDGSITPNRFRPMKQQVHEFFLPNYAQNNTSKATWKSDNTLFASFFGINDVTGTYQTGNSTIHSAIIASYNSLVNELYAAGARNFLFLSVPAVHRSPLTMNQGSMSAQFVEMERVAIADFNMRIMNMVQRLVQQHTDVTAFFYDTFTLFNQVLDKPDVKPETEGLKNTTGFCFSYSRRTYNESTFNATCQIPQNEYFWLDSLHPTPPIHDTMAAEISVMLMNSEAVTGNGGNSSTNPTVFQGASSRVMLLPMTNWKWAVVYLCVIRLGLALI
ncbi:uncharacterized protein BDR25DRAFT_386053 [Lindgomyces ingoldianus]|uniref:Uncharacterized protein n=1 Tax=Lindgomyces ingoldianus TaxID=673940 RepID=A0ACB6Q7N8_9PLEO|nr:uncharacterized protein BDR25DRAFT_386053 [Lindgomyces ingoldianus]KAF2462825.1 hypothetical protein BDR25DRAFT_386053 [Lindgomyces ingoldianus]